MARSTHEPVGVPANLPFTVALETSPSGLITTRTSTVPGTLYWSLQLMTRPRTPFTPFWICGFSSPLPTFSGMVFSLLPVDPPPLGRLFWQQGWLESTRQATSSHGALPAGFLVGAGAG